MAIYHLSAKTISRSGNGSAGAKADYIQREGKYARGRDELLHSESGNMPEWAERSTDYWTAADRYERANGRLCKQMDFALPVELSRGQRQELANSFARSLTEEEKLPFTLAVHAGGGENPHAHLMISERINDDMNRPAELWFKRYNGKQPERGGARKTEALKPEEWLEKTRERWADMCNQALARAGHEARVDHRSLEAQGITDRQPQIHIGPTAAELEKRGVSTDRGDTARKITAANDRIADIARKLSDLVRVQQERRKEEDGKAREKTTEAARSEMPLNAPRIDFGYQRDKLSASGTKARQETPNAEEKPALPSDLPSLRKLWDTELKKVLSPVLTKISRIEREILASLDGFKNRRYEHRKSEPRAPEGLFAVFREKGYRKDLAVWTKTKHMLDKRIEKLSTRLDRVRKYMRDGLWGGPSPARQMAERRLGRKLPDLAQTLERAERLDELKKRGFRAMPSDRRIEAERLTAEVCSGTPVIHQADAGSGKTFSGRIVAVTEHQAVQQIGANVFVVHDRNELAGKIPIGRSVEIRYRNGIGYVFDPNRKREWDRDRGSNRGRGR